MFYLHDSLIYLTDHGQLLLRKVLRKSTIFPHPPTRYPPVSSGKWVGLWCPRCLQSLPCQEVQEGVVRLLMAVEAVSKLYDRSLFKGFQRL